MRENCIFEIQSLKQKPCHAINKFRFILVD